MYCRYLDPNILSASPSITAAFLMLVTANNLNLYCTNRSEKIHRRFLLAYKCQACYATPIFMMFFIAGGVSFLSILQQWVAVSAYEHYIFFIISYWRFLIFSAARTIKQWLAAFFIPNVILGICYPSTFIPPAVLVNLWQRSFWYSGYFEFLCYR